MLILTKYENSNKEAKNNQGEKFFEVE